MNKFCLCLLACCGIIMFSAGLLRLSVAADERPDEPISIPWAAFEDLKEWSKLYPELKPKIRAILIDGEIGTREYIKVHDIVKAKDAEKKKLQEQRRVFIEFAKTL